MKAIVYFFCFWQVMGLTASLGQTLSLRERDNLKTQSITLVKEFEQLLNVLAHRSTTPADVQDLVTMATSDEQTRIFKDPHVVVEDDFYVPNPDSLEPKDVSIRKYLHDWDLFYTKGYQETVSFSDLRVSEVQNKGYLFVKVFYLSQLKNKNRELNRFFSPTRRVASIRFDWVGGKYKGAINGIAFFRAKAQDGSAFNQASIESEFKPFINDHRIRLGIILDSSITENQIAQQIQNDSLYSLALSARMKENREENGNELAYARALSRGDSFLVARNFVRALDAYSEARAYKPLEAYPRVRINELSRFISPGASDPRQMFNNQYIEGDRLFAARDYEGARQAYRAAYLIMPDNKVAADKLQLTEKIVKTKASIRAKYQAGNYRLALRDLGKAIGEDKNNPDGYYERALCLASQEDNKKALADLQTALTLDPEFVDALKLRVMLWTRVKDRKKAIEDLQKLISLQPGEYQHHQQKGFLHVQANEWDAALAEFDLALSLHPEDIQSATKKAEVLRKKSGPESAEKAIELALKINPGFSSAIFQKGLILFEKGEEAKAGYELLKAANLGLNADEQGVINQYHDEFLKVARAKAQARPAQTQEAVTFANKALFMKPKSLEGHLFLAEQLRLGGKKKEAFSELDYCISVKEHYLPAHLKKGQWHLEDGNEKAARSAFLLVAQQDPKNQEACLGMGDLLMAAQSLDSALLWFNRSFLIKSSNPNALLKRGKCHFQMANFTKALLDFENAIREDNSLAEGHFWKGKVNRSLKKPFDAIDNFNEASRMGYDPYDCLIEIGKTHLSQDNHKQAIKYFTTAITRNPGHFEGFSQRGLSYLKREEFDLAKADLITASHLDSSFNHVDSHLALGFLHLRSGAWAEGQPIFSRILNLDPNHEMALYGMGVVCFHQGKKEEAFRHLENAFQSGKLDPDTTQKDPWMKELARDPGFIALKKK